MRPAGIGVVRIVTAFAPLLLTPALSRAINNGTLNFGGGEKDIVLIIPWLLWSVGFAAAALVCWRRHVRLSRSLVWSATWATGIVLSIALAFALLAPGLLGSERPRVVRA